MAAKPQKKVTDSKKRKRISSQTSVEPKSFPKKPKLNSSNIQNQVAKKTFKLNKQNHQKQGTAPRVKTDEVIISKKQRRLNAKELAEARKKKRKKHYSLEQELAMLWEEMRCRNIANDDRSRLVSEALKKMEGKITEIASFHISSRVLQTCVKHCTQDERNAVFSEIRPHLIALASNTYAVHLVTKMLDNASKEQLAEIYPSLHGHVASLLRHMVGSLELYSPELQLFKDMATMKETSYRNHQSYVT